MENRDSITMARENVHLSTEVAEIGELAAQLILEKTGWKINPISLMRSYMYMFHAIQNFLYLKYKIERCPRFEINLCGMLSMSYESPDENEDFPYHFRLDRYQIAESPIGIDKILEMSREWSAPDIQGIPLPEMVSRYIKTMG